MFESAITLGDPQEILEEKKSTAVVLGYGVIAIILWLLSLMVNRRLAGTFTDFQVSLILGCGSVLLMALGLLTRKYGRGQDTIVFLSLSLFALCISGILFVSTVYRGNITSISHHVLCSPVIGSRCYSWIALAWGTVFGYLSFFARRSDLSRILFLLMLCVAVTIGAIAGWTNQIMLKRIGGYLLIIAAICAFLNAASSFILSEMKKPLC